jgi:PAS domain S-box-containing protein
MTSPAEVGADIACRRTLDHVAAPIRIWAAGAGVVYANRAWCELTGSAPEDNAGDGWLQFVHEEDRAALQESTVPPDAAREYRVRRHDGRAVAVTEHATPWADQATGAVTGIVHTVSPRVTDEDHRGMSMSKWAHELRGPLNAILGWSDLLSAGDSATDVVQRGLKAIANNARQQAQIIKRMTES